MKKVTIAIVALLVVAGVAYGATRFAVHQQVKAEKEQVAKDINEAFGGEDGEQTKQPCITKANQKVSFKEAKAMTKGCIDSEGSLTFSWGGSCPDGSMFVYANIGDKDKDGEDERVFAVVAPGKTVRTELDTGQMSKFEMECSGDGS